MNLGEILLAAIMGVPSVTVARTGLKFTRKRPIGIARDMFGGAIGV